VHWAETDYGLSAGQQAVLPEGKGKGKGKVRADDQYPFVCLSVIPEKF